MNLFYYPAKVLEIPCEVVVDFNDELNLLLDGMKEVMLKHNGLGLSANQVGVSKRVMIVKNNKGEIYEFINPVVIDVADADSLPEGCLSFPGIFLDIIRPTSVMFQYQDRTGEVKKAMAEGIEARCFLHEMDHLKGKTMLDSVNRDMRKTVKSKMKKRK
jgi:peptide deformylase